MPPDLARQPERADRATVRLSPRQVECLRWVAAGKSSWDIGQLLGLSRRTVEGYIAVACARLGVRGRTQAVVVAGALGLLEASPFFGGSRPGPARKESQGR